jgi:hypothetical protein
MESQKLIVKLEPEMREKTALLKAPQQFRGEVLDNYAAHLVKEIVLAGK